MIVQNILLAAESFTHDNWVYRDINVSFSRLYYILDGEAYYEEDGHRVRLKKNHLYLTPVKKCFTLYDNPSNRLLHTYVHITTIPTVDRFLEFEVPGGSPLSDAVALWRRHIRTENTEFLQKAIELILSCILPKEKAENTVAEQARRYLDSLGMLSYDAARMCRELGYSREHITRSFLTVYRCTPRQYLQRQRMNIALDQLLEGSTVGRVADLLCYASPYAFSKAFKNHFGQSPEKYLLLVRKKPYRPKNNPQKQ